MNGRFGGIGWACLWALAALGLAGCQTPGQKLLGVVEVTAAAKDDPLALEIRKEPIAALRKGLAWYEANVRDYTCTLYKLERLDPDAPDFLDEQKVLCKFKEGPFSVFTETVANPRGAVKALYVEGQWDGKMKARTGGLLPITVSVEPRGAMARQNTLRFIDQFGFKRSLTAILDALETARREKISRLQVVGTGLVGQREVLILESWINEPKPTGRFEFPHTRIYLDRQWRLPLGVDLWDASGIERGRYRMTDVRFNVGLTDADFTLKACGM